MLRDSSVKVAFSFTDVGNIAATTMKFINHTRPQRHGQSILEGKEVAQANIRLEHMMIDNGNSDYRNVS